MKSTKRNQNNSLRLRQLVISGDNDRRLTVRTSSEIFDVVSEFSNSYNIQLLDHAFYFQTKFVFDFIS